MQEDSQQMPVLTEAQIECRKADCEGTDEHKKPVNVIRASFAWKLAKYDFFTKEERWGRNCNGVGKKRLNQTKLNEIKRLCLKYYPVTPPGDKEEEARAWKLATQTIDKNNRS